MPDPTTIAYVLAAFMLALWWGERGRRLDAQKREAGRDIIPPRAASVSTADERDTSPTELVEGGPLAELAEAPEEFIEETMADAGCSREEAVAEWHRLLNKLPTGGEGVEWPVTS